MDQFEKLGGRFFREVLVAEAMRRVQPYEEGNMGYRRGFWFAVQTQNKKKQRGLLVVYWHPKAKDIYFDIAITRDAGVRTPSLEEWLKTKHTKEAKSAGLNIVELPKDRVWVENPTLWEGKDTGGPILVAQPPTILLFKVNTGDQTVSVPGCMDMKGSLVIKFHKEEDLKKEKEAFTRSVLFLAKQKFPSLKRPLNLFAFVDSIVLGMMKAVVGSTREEDEGEKDTAATAATEAMID